MEADWTNRLRETLDGKITAILLRRNACSCESKFWRPPTLVPFLSGYRLFFCRSDHDIPKRNMVVFAALKINRTR